MKAEIEKQLDGLAQGGPPQGALDLSEIITELAGEVRRSRELLSDYVRDKRQVAELLKCDPIQKQIVERIHELNN